MIEFNVKKKKDDEKNSLLNENYYKKWPFLEEKRKPMFSQKT